MSSRFSWRRVCVAVLLFISPCYGGAAQATEVLKILVYGASGKVGTQVVIEALERGHVVTAVSRDPSRIEQKHDNLSAVAGDLLDSKSIANLVIDQDVIIVSVRGIVAEPKIPENAIQLIGAKKVVGVLQGIGHDAPRLIHVGGAGTLEVEPGVLYADKLPKLFLSKSLESEIQGQVLALEFFRTVSDVSWSYATPARNFTNGKRTGTFRIGGDAMLEDSRGKNKISRRDFAVALIDEAENANYVRRRFSVVY